MDIEAPRVAKAAKPGQFIIIRNDKKGDRSSTVELLVVCLQFPRQNAKREPVRQPEQQQECEQPEGLQTEEADPGKSTCKLQSGNLEQPKHGPEYQYQNQLHDALQHRGHISRTAVAAGKSQMEPVCQKKAE